MLIFVLIFCRKLNLTVTYSPISLLRWQMYAAQNMRSKWYSMLGADFMEDSDNDQDSLKVLLDRSISEIALIEKDSSNESNIRVQTQTGSDNEYVR